MSENLIEKAFSSGLWDSYKSAEDAYFGHYTSAQNAINILRNKEIWLRNVRAMNDLSEVEHGRRQVVSYFGANGKFGLAWQKLDSYFEGLSDEIKSQFDNFQTELLHNTFISCFAKMDEQQLTSGKLSMWRAYAPKNGVCIVFNGAPFVGEVSDVGVNTFPVTYPNPSEVEATFDRVRDAIRNTDFPDSSWERNALGDRFLEFLFTATFCMKHPCFKEEDEWRLVRQPWRQDNPNVQRRIELIAGVPQPVFAFPIKNQPDKGLIGLDFDIFVKKVIVGPSEHPDLIAEAITAELRAAGVTNPHDRIEYSGVPLRIA